MIMHHSFEKDLYYSAVPQNSAQGQRILQVIAKDDLDFGDNAEIEYTIESGNGSTYFSVIPETGKCIPHFSCVNISNFISVSLYKRMIKLLSSIFLTSKTIRKKFRF